MENEPTEGIRSGFERLTRGDIRRIFKVPKKVNVESKFEAIMRDATCSACWHKPVDGHKLDIQMVDGKEEYTVKCSECPNGVCVRRKKGE